MMTEQEILDSINTERIEKESSDRRDMERLRAGADSSPLTGYAGIMAEVERAQRKFPTWPTDPLHALAVLGEEYGELLKETVQATYEPHKSDRAAVRREAIQTAAMAVRFLMSLDAYEYRPRAQHEQRRGCAACDRGDHQIGHASWCPHNVRFSDGREIEFMDSNTRNLEQPKGRHSLQAVVRTLRWQREQAILATIAAIPMSIWSWQFAAGMAISAWIGYLDHRFGKQSPNGALSNGGNAT